MLKMARLLRAMGVLSRLSAALLVSTNGHAFAATDVKLPAPYVSRAFDAVLLPINNRVRKEFKLGAKERGVLVLSVKPGGTADKQGLKPGDVLSDINGHKIYKPIDVDEVVYYWTGKGKNDFSAHSWRGGTKSRASYTITRADYSLAIDVATVAVWSSVAVAAFSYSEFYSEYSSEMSSSYASSETSIEQATSSESFSEEAAKDDADTDNDGVADGAEDDAADTGDDAGGNDDAGNDAGEIDGGDDSGADDSGDDSGSDDSGGEDDGGGDDSGGDDSGGDDSSGDDGGGDDGGGDE